MTVAVGDWLQDTRAGGDCYWVTNVHAAGLVELRAVRTGQLRTVSQKLIEHVCVPCSKPPTVPWSGCDVSPLGSG